LRTLIRKAAITFISALAGFAILFTPVWYWSLVNWAQLEWAYASGAWGIVIGVFYAASTYLRTDKLRILASIFLVFWLCLYLFALSSILPHCRFDAGAFGCIVDKY
jgi:hypothetical protein